MIEQLGMSLPKPIISIVTPTYNRKDELIHLIESIQRQSLSPEYFEMIISDDGSSDGTAEKVKGLQKASSPRAIGELRTGASM